MSVAPDVALIEAKKTGNLRDTSVWTPVLVNQSDGTLLGSGGRDGAVRIWRVE